MIILKRGSGREGRKVASHGAGGNQQMLHSYRAPPTFKPALPCLQPGEKGAGKRRSLSSRNGNAFHPSEKRETCAFPLAPTHRPFRVQQRPPHCAVKPPEKMGRRDTGSSSVWIPCYTPVAAGIVVTWLCLISIFKTHALVPAKTYALPRFTWYTSIYNIYSCYVQY